MVDIGKMVGDSFGYAKEALVGKWVNWLLLIISCIIFPLAMGYTVRIMKGVTPAPELKDWWPMFVDGLKLFVIGLIYAIPILILLFFFFGSAILTAAATSVADPKYMVAFFMGMILYLVLLVIVGIIIALIVSTAYPRFARTGSIGEAFNFGAISVHIGKIGWGGYILALIVIYLIIGIIGGILMAIPVVGWVLYFIALPFLLILEARYLSLLYDTAGSA
ncbi:MAG: DUF4013 domain-containing protein [Methanoregulaceae archaeon]